MNWLRQIRELWQGRQGVPVSKTATLPGNTGSVDLFTIVGGRVRLTDLVGSIVTPPGGTAASILARLQHTLPGVAATDMCGNIADIRTWVANRLLTITGAVGAAMADSGVTGVQVLQSFGTNQQTLEPGVISLLVTEGAPGTITGAIKWTLRYTPMDPGATIVPA